MSNVKKYHIKYDDIQFIAIQQAEELMFSINPEKNRSIVMAKQSVEKLKYISYANYGLNFSKKRQSEV